MSSDFLKSLEEMTLEDINYLAERFKNGISVKDRRRFFKMYPTCFVGNEATQWFIKDGKCKTKEEAVFLGQKLMDSGIFCHVLEDHQFENAKLFYKFNSPDAIVAQKKEREAFTKSSWLEKKGMTDSWSPYWVELKGNILKYYNEPKGTVKGTFNILGCKIEANSVSSRAFEISCKKGSIAFKAENEQAKNVWVSFICRAKDRTLAERKQLLEEWKKMGECTSCIAALASEQAEGEEQSEAIQEPQTESSEKKEKVEMNKETLENPLSELFSLPVAAIDEKTLILKDVFHKDIVVIALLRHFG